MDDFEVRYTCFHGTVDGKPTYEEYTNYINCNKEKLLDPLLLDAVNHVLNVSKLYSSIPVFVNYRDLIKKK